MNIAELSPIFISLKTASLSILITFFLGIFAAWFVADMRRGVLKLLLDALFTLPLVLPPTVAGFFLLYIFGVRGPLGKFFLDFFSVRIAFSWGATVLAASTISFPLMYRSARGALELVDSNFTHAARTLGLTEWRIFWLVRFPCALPGIASGGALAFARGLGEFGATAMIAGNIAEKTRTLPLSIYSNVNANDMKSVNREVAVMVIISFIVLALLYIWGDSGAARSAARDKRKRK